MKIKKVLSVLAAAVLLCGCSGDKSDGEYVDINEQEKKIEETELDIEVAEFSYDDKPYNIMKLSYTIDNEFFYDFSWPNMKIDLSSGRVRYVCSLAGCAHTEGSSGCISYQDFNSPIATTDGIYYVKDDKVMLYKGDSEETILTNTYYTDYEEEFYPDSKCSLSAIIMCGDELYVKSATFYFTYNLKSGEISKMHELSDTLIMSMAVDGDYVYYSTDNMEFFVYDPKNDTSTKLADKVGQVCCKDDKVYFIQYDSEIPNLYVADKGGANIKKLIENCYVNYYITDNCIYYQNYDVEKKCYRCDLDGKNAEMLDFEAALKEVDLEDVPTTYYNIISNSNLNHVFFVLTEENLIFAMEDGSAEIKTIQVTEE